MGLNSNLGKKNSSRYSINSTGTLYLMGWLMGLEPTTTGITILTFNYLRLLIDVGTLYINQQLTDK